MTNAIERPAAVSAGPAPGSAAARFAAVRDAAHALLPRWLARLALGAAGRSRPCRVCAGGAPWPARISAFPGVEGPGG